MLLKMKISIILLQCNESLCIKSLKNVNLILAKIILRKLLYVSGKIYLYEFQSTLLTKVKNLEIKKNKGLVKKLWFIH